MCRSALGDDGALVDFVPRESDLEWRRGASRKPVESDPPDSCWLCARHAACGRLLSTRLDIDRGLDTLREADEGIDVRGRLSDSIEIDAWERILRRALPDFAVEIGSDDTEIEEDAQNPYFGDSEIPPGAANWVSADVWTVNGHLAEVSVDRTQIYWRTGGIARVDIHIGAVSPHAPGWTVWVTPEPDATRFSSAHVTMSGEPSPLMMELLERYGLEPARVRR